MRQKNHNKIDSLFRLKIELKNGHISHIAAIERPAGVHRKLNHLAGLL